MLAEPGQPLPQLVFVPEVDSCPSCDKALGVYKTHCRTVTTLAQGRFEAKETLLRCDRGSPGRNKFCPTVGSKELARLVPSGQSFGYDLIVYVGLARYLDGKQRDEIRDALQQRGIKLSTGSISKVCDRFLAYLTCLHLRRTPQLRAAMSQGYSLHIDATCDKGKGGHFLCLDGIRGWVLWAERIASENGELLAPVVDSTVKLFGDPIATVRDLGQGMAAAVEPLRQRGIPDLICHYHYLRAVGTRLLKQPYDRLRDLLKKSAVRSGLVALRKQLRPYLKEEVDPRIRGDLIALVHWLIEGQGKKDPCFPFALPHLELVLRCLSATDVANSWVPRPWSVRERRAMRTLDSLLRKLHKDRRLAQTIAELQDSWRVFCELRAVLRLDDSALPGGQRARQLPIAAAELLRLHDIRTAVRQYEHDLRQRAGDEAKKKRPSKPEAIVLKYLEYHRDHLFGHPVIRDGDGQVIVVVDRTNNPPEHFFGRSKQQLRRRLGRANLSRDLQQQPAQAALVANLRRPDYVQVLCGSIDNLPNAFSRLDRANVTKVRLTRDHRDSRLHRLVQKRLDQAPPPETARLPPFEATRIPPLETAHIPPIDRESTLRATGS